MKEDWYSKHWRKSVEEYLPGIEILAIMPSVWHKKTVQVTTREGRKTFIYQIPQSDLTQPQNSQQEEPHQ